MNEITVNIDDKVNAPIGVFDSGVGGLTVILELLQQMPHESFIYYADTAHVPYGPRDPQELKAFAMNITKYLVGQGCKMIIIACNTSTSLAFEDLQKLYEIPIIGVIEPGVDKALQTTGNNRIGVIGTLATMNSRAYQRLIQAKNPETAVIASACPLFVPLIEKGAIDGEEITTAAQMYVQPLKEQGIDTLILGCTHYPFIQPVLAKLLGTSVTTIDPARETVSRAKEKLRELSLLKSEGQPSTTYVASGEPEAFREIGSAFLGRPITAVQKVSLD